MSTTAVREKPILFSGPMIRAILEGRKTQTRRVFKHNQSFDGHPELDDAVREAAMKLCPYEVGMRLWVRETWGQSIDEKGTCCVCYRADDSARYYLADYGGEGDPVELAGPAVPWQPPHKWRPSIFMKRWASRITLEVTDIRAERVRAISAADADAEGAGMDSVGDGLQQLNQWAKWSVRVARERSEPRPVVTTSEGAFAMLWEKLNAKRGYGWETNPWVWAYTFRRLEQ